MPKKPVSVALIGCGTVAQYGHLPAITQCPGLKLAAIAEVNKDTRQKIENTYAVPGYADYHELLKRDDIVGVTVCTTLSSHYEVVAAALKAGKHVFCEKPMADSPAHCRAMVALSNKHERMLALNLEYRFDPAILTMKKAVKAREIGKLQVMRFVYNWSAHGTKGANGARRAAFLQTGGGAMDCGVHSIDLARFLSGSEFDSISARGQWFEPEYRFPSHVMVQARMKSGVLVLIENSYSYTHNSQTENSVMRTEVIGDDGVVSWYMLNTLPGSTVKSNGAGGELQILTKKRTEFQAVGAGKEFGDVYADWARCLGKGNMQGSSLATGADGAAATETMWKILVQTDKERPKA